MPGGSDLPLAERYGLDAVAVFTPDERRRFLDASGRPRNPAELPWELLYRLEPELYERLIRSERLHPGILEWFPEHVTHILEVAAGTGRLTVELAPRCDRLVAVEPAQPLRRRLEKRVAALGHTHVETAGGFFDSLPVTPPAFDIVVSCAAFAPDAVDDPDGCLASMEGRCAPGGLTVLVWPNHVEWLRERGYQHVVFTGEMAVDYESVDEAVALARIFYPHAVDEIARRGSPVVPYELLGINPPRDLCWKAAV